MRYNLTRLPSPSIEQERYCAMSRNYKPNRDSVAQAPLFELPPADVHPKERERVEQLIAAGKSGPALDIAKDIHKRRHSDASEALLLDAYGARLASLVERKLDRDAKALMDLVRERYPAARERLREWNATLAARNGDLSVLLEPLNDSSLTAEKQAAIAGQVRRDVLDLRALAECQTLAPGHPLRAAATALRAAFDAVTSGPVTDEALALPEVSRQSPLAPWKMLVRAIAAFYRRDEALCEKLLAAIEPESAASRLAPALHAMTHHRQNLGPASMALVNQVNGNLEVLRAALKRLDSAFDRRNQSLILQEIPNAVQACRQAEPGLLERLKQHISVRAMMAKTPVPRVAAALGGPSLKNAYFWRLLARGSEEDRNHDPMQLADACSEWEQFRRHAVHEGWFPAKGPEAAALYLHMADLLNHISLEDRQAILHRYGRSFDGHASYYRDQPAEIRAVAPSRSEVDLYFLSPHQILERACEADPCAENFERWLRHATEALPDSCDLVAQRWSAALPNDIPPLLYLMQSAEKRNALQKAFKFMERAEQIDGLNPDVRRARLRLLVAMAVRHLREEKPHLAEKDLRQIEVLPQAQQGDRPAFVAALRSVWCLARNAPKEAAAAYQEASRFLGDGPTAQLLLLQVQKWCGGRYSEFPKETPTVPFFAAFGRVCALCDDMGIPVNMVPGMQEQMMGELAAPNVSANPRFLAALGEAAMREQDDALAYAVSRAGLAQGAESQARFLFLRARSLPPWEEDRHSDCLAAASELARRHHDSDLLREIGGWREEQLDWLDVPDQPRAAPSSEEIGKVIQRELKERDFPQQRPASRRAPVDDEECQCPACCAQRGELPEEMAEMIETLGPDVVAKALAEMIGLGGKKKRKRRSYLNDDDFPF